MSRAGVQMVRAMLLSFDRGEIETVAFCDSFDRSFIELDAERETLDPVESRVLWKLYETLSWYSPFPEDAAVPAYIDDAGVRAAVREACVQLDEHDADRAR